MRNMWERLGPVERPDKLGATTEQNEKAEGYVKAGTWAPKLKVSGFSEPARMAPRPLPSLLSTHSRNKQVLSQKSCGGRL